MKNTRTEQLDQNPLAANELKEWETPELVVEDVTAVTRGATIGDLEADDAFYS
jgi:hypothetical protein